MTDTTTATRLPRHVAIIMDGNGRWAKSRGLDRSEGHIEGVNTVNRITKGASEAGVEYLTLYAFSTENWNRPQAEVDALMHLIGIAIRRETPNLLQNNVRLQLIGDLERMPAQALQCLRECEQATAGCTGLVLTLALSYSARWEITRAAAQIARAAAAGDIDPSAVTQETLAEHLSTAGMPDPDLMIRTGGDRRISNFLLWQAAYAELWFTDTYWPDFSVEELQEALHSYAGRERRFGLTSEQVS